ncbi:MAG: hypothetical protein ACFE0O_08970 [Opitutales bacterium]
MPVPGRIALTLLLLILAAGALLVGAAIPVHFRAVSPRVLEAAGRGTPDWQERATWYVDAAAPGPAGRLVGLLGERDPEAAEALQQRIAALEAEAPVLAWSGGEAPYFAAWYEPLPVAELEPDPSAHVFGLAISAYARDQLARFLNNSRNAGVQAVLDGRALKGVTRFMPVGSPGGAPLETAILLNALLIQGDNLPEAMVRFLRTATAAAVQPEPNLQAVRSLENYYMAFLTLAKRLDWTSLERALEAAETPETAARLAEVLRADPEAGPTLIATTLMQQPAGAVLDFLAAAGTDPATLRQAMAWGEGALAELLAQQKPLYRTPPLLEPVQPWIERLETAFFTRLVLERPGLAFWLRMAVFLLAGMLLTLFVVRCFQATGLGEEPEPGRPLGLLRLRTAVGGLAAAALFWALLEPALLEETGPTRAQLRFDFSFAEAVGSLSAKPMNLQSIDQVTLLVLLIFFLVQVIIYVFCLIKIAEIRKHDADPTLKIELLNNEDNLFDAGLYVGLGGTVLALILVTLGIVEASLMAAYASTLFGIVFVALLKILHVRPFRRRLLLSADRNH